jgi:FlaA1/EpsC-like NDP-sugar epimerase
MLQPGLIRRYKRRLSMHPIDWMALGHDIAAAMIAWYLAYWLRFNTEIPQYNIPNMLAAMLWVVPLQAIVFYGCGMYRGLWRYAGLPDLQRIGTAAVLSILAIALVLLMLPPQEPPVPRSVIVLDPILLILILGGSRLGYRLWKERRLRKALGAPGRPLVILGAGDAAATLLTNLGHAGDWNILGLFDDNPEKRGRQIQGVNVLGSLEDLVDLAPRLGVKRAIVAMPATSHQSRRRALDICRRCGVEVLTVPSYQDLVSGIVTVSHVRSIELDDLLGREPPLLDESGMQEWLRGRCVLVTGDGGSIASELCRQIARFNPARLILYESNEVAPHRTAHELAEQHPGIAFECVIGDIKNPARAAETFAVYRPQIVFHAAAYKHVPLIDQHDASEAVQHNVLGTWRIAEAAITHGVDKFVMVSTQRGGKPTDVMSASKQLAEIICQRLQTENTTRFIIVRVGNVLDSTRRVISKFRAKIACGGPISIAHPETTGYFMSTAHAAQLVLQAGLIGTGGELFVPEMGEPVKEVDLAREYIRLSGYGESDIRIEFTGTPSGEDRSQESTANGEHTLPTTHPGLRILKSHPELDATWIAGLLIWLQQDLPQSEQAERDLERVFCLAGIAHSTSQ